MFKVIDKTTDEIFTVYGLNGTHFLIYKEELDWWYFKPIDECRPYTHPEFEKTYLGKWVITDESCDD